MAGKLEVFVDECYSNGVNIMWMYFDVSIMILGLLANKALLCLFLRERKSLSASQVLGVNLVVMDVIFLYTIPMWMLFTFETGSEIGQNHTVTLRQSLNYTYPLLFKIGEGCNMLNLIGCPMLLTCMCIERYLAVMRPVLYLKVRRWEYRMAVSAVVWAITSIAVLVTSYNTEVILTSVSVIISCLFILMLICLVGVIWSLQQQSPALSTNTTKRSTETTLKRQAVGNVLVVVVPAIMSYFPVLLLFPMVFYMSYSNQLDENMCLVSELLYLFPRFGVFIGPLFYFSKARHACRLSV